MLRHISGQRDALDLTGLLDGGGVLLANLSRGALGELNARLLGMVLLHKLERMAVEWSAVPAERRRRVHVYLDDFQEFGPRRLWRLLAAGRKFNVGVMLAHQQLEDP